MSFDIGKNRRTADYTTAEKCARVLWAIIKALFFRPSPRLCYSWRNMLLRMFGAQVGANVRISNTVDIFVPWNLVVHDYSAIGERATVYNLAKISIGSCVTISQGVHLCGGTHDYIRADMQLLKCPIAIQDQAWICADAYIGPDVTVGRCSIVGARAVVIRDVPESVIVAGNPAKVVKLRPTIEECN